MKIIDRATARLTAIYTGILMLISISFSVVIGMAAMNELNRPYDQIPKSFIERRISDDFIEAYQDRVDVASGKIVASLIFINLAVLVFGLATSYFLARWTLKPIEKAMDDESRFVSDASHELRTPLATMQMENEVMLRDKEVTKADLRQQIQSNLEEIDRLRQLTNSLLRMSSTSEVEISRIDASTAVNDAIERVAKSAEMKNIAINNEVKSMTVNSNLEALTEIIAIYLDNAVKYSPSDSTVTICSPNNKTLSVIDQGDGVADKDLPNVFNRFYRSDESRNSEGFGLGLSLAQRLAKQTHSRLSVHNVKAGGAAFTIHFD